jgi:hypothetical protein
MTENETSKEGANYIYPIRFLMNWIIFRGNKQKRLNIKILFEEYFILLIQVQLKQKNRRGLKRDKAKLAGEEKVNNSNIGEYSSDKVFALEVKVKRNSGMDTNVISV